jgi:hypothetical protein
MGRLATTVKIIDLTDDPLCVNCLLEAAHNGLNNEQLAGREAPSGIKLTSEQARSIRKSRLYKPSGTEFDPAPTPFEPEARTMTIWGLPVWEVDE